MMLVEPVNILLVVKRICRLFLILLLLSVFLAKPVHANLWASDTIQKMAIQVFFIVIGMTVIAAIINAVIEVLTLYILRLRGRRVTLTVIVANLITWPFFFYIVYSTNIEWLTIIFLEIVVVVVETFIIYLFNRELRLLKLFLKVGVANFISAILGTVFIYALAIFILPKLINLPLVPDSFF